MFEKIAKLIKDIPSVELVAPKLEDAGYVATFQSNSILRVDAGETQIIIIQLWGNKVLLRGFDKKGKPREVTTNQGR